MSENLLLSFQITIIGMALVFAAIVLLWGVLALIVRLGAARSEEPAVANAAAERLLRQRAAAAAVAIALAQKSSIDLPQEFPLPPTALVSPWQAVMRSHILNKRGHVR